MKSTDFLRHIIPSLVVATLLVMVSGCFDPDASLREKAMAAVQKRTDLTANRSVQMDSAQVYVGKSAATVVIPYGMQKADGTTIPGSIVVSFNNMGKRWDLDQITDSLALR